MRRRKALISGASIAGPALSCWLVRRGFDVVLVERAPALRPGGHAIDVRGKALDVLDRMGLTARVREARTQLATISAVRGEGPRSYATRALAFGPERDYTRFLGAYVAIYTVDNLLDLRDRAIMYNEPNRGAAMFTVRGNARAKVMLVFRDRRLEAALARWDRDLRPTVRKNQRLAATGLRILIPASRPAIWFRNQGVRLLPLGAFAGQIERASRSADLPP